MAIDGGAYQSDICVGSRSRAKASPKPQRPTPQKNPGDDHDRGRDTPNEQIPNDSPDPTDATGQTTTNPGTPPKQGDTQPAPPPRPRPSTSSPSSPAPSPSPTKSPAPTPTAPPTATNSNNLKRPSPSSRPANRPSSTSVIAYATATPATHQLRLRGHAVTARLTPIRYDWHFGNNTQTTLDPGAPYPNHTVYHVYREPGPTTISLTITWRIEYRTSQTGWRTASDTITTTSPEHRLLLVESTPHLVP